MKQLVPERLLAPLRVAAGDRLELPSDLLREARQRVAIAAGVGALAYLVYLLFGLSNLGSPTAFERSANLTSNLTGFWLCLSLFLVSRAGRVPDATVFVVALVVEVALCLLISFEAPWVAWETTGHVVTLTWAVPVIILVPLLVPSPPATTIAVSLLAGGTMPGGLALLHALGVVAVRPSHYWTSSVSALVAVGIAAVGSRTIHGAGRRIAEARRIGSYQLETLLGKGGMGEVWVASHAFLARPAAVKLIRSDSLAAGHRESHAAVESRFEREAQATAGLRSRHTVELYDFGRSGQGVFYYAMELLQGINAEHFVYRFGAVPVARAVHWLVQACDSLGEAHAQKLVHRDIKPSNLYVCRYGRDADIVKVLDFGLVKSTQAAAVEAEEMPATTPGQRLGTPGYMAPEQIFGQTTDARTDIYALGCVAYWLLAGRKPFEAESAGDLSRMHAQESPPALAGLCTQDIPQGVADVVMACLAKSPQDRPQDVDAIAAQLRAAVEASPWTEMQAQAWWSGEGAVLLKSPGV